MNAGEIGDEQNETPPLTPGQITRGVGYLEPNFGNRERLTIKHGHGQGPGPGTSTTAVIPCSLRPLDPVPPVPLLPSLSHLVGSEKSRITTPEQGANCRKGQTVEASRPMLSDGALQSLLQYQRMPFHSSTEKLEDKANALWKELDL